LPPIQNMPGIEFKNKGVVDFGCAPDPAIKAKD
jgi:hypothetical protein